jgi:hypothetical protein
MKQALISPTEKVYKYDGTLLGDRVAETTTSPFEVAPPLFWMACNDDVQADQWYYDPNTFTIDPIPVKPAPPVPSPSDAPTVI